jgi:DNA-directed RNA polymerase specialized sigma24 family protein
MTEQGLLKLLASFSEDPDRGAELYVHVQRKLVRYFRLNGCVDEEKLADEVLDRFARRLCEGERVERPISYVLGIARRVLLETKPLRIAGIPEIERVSAPGVADNEGIGCLERCLDELPPESRALLLEYYSAEAVERIRLRQRMADRMGLSLNALRNRALRLRRNLEVCIENCLDPDRANDGDAS